MKNLSIKALTSLIIEKIPNHVVYEKLAGKALPFNEREMNELAKELLYIQSQAVINIEKGIPEGSIPESNRIKGQNGIVPDGIISPGTNLVYIFDLIRNVSIYESCEINQLSGFEREQFAVMKPEIDYKMQDVSGFWHWFRNHSIVLAVDNKGVATYILGVLEDVTDQKANETALIASQELYSDLVSNQSVGIYRILVQKPENGKSIIESTLFEFMSDRFCEFFEVEKIEFLKDPIASTLKRIHPDDLNEFIKSNETAQKSLEPYVRETRLLIDNNIKWLRFESSPRKLEDGSIRWTGVVADITEQKLTGKALNTSEQRQRFILESLPVAVYSSPFDPEYDTTWISGNVKEITGFEKEEYIAKNDFWRMRLHPNDKDRVLKAFINFPLNGEMVIEYRWKCRDDQYHWFHDRSVLLESESQKEFLGVIADITDRKKAEESIRISEERYHMLLELASDAFFQGNKNGDFITVNSAAISQTGYSRDELLKMNMKDLFTNETLKEKPLKYDLLKSGVVLISERELIRKDRKLIIVEMNSSMMPDGTFQSFFRDITQRKITENALKRKITELQIYYELAISRERKMIALKSEINLLLERLGEQLKY